MSYDPNQPYNPQPGRPSSYGSSDPYGAPPQGPSMSQPTDPYSQSPYAQASYGASGYSTSAVGMGALGPIIVHPLPPGQAIRQMPGQFWRALTHPNPITFAAEQGKASWSAIWVLLLFEMVILAGISFITWSLLIPMLISLLSSGNSSLASDPQSLQQVKEAFAGFSIFFAVFNIVLVVIGFFFSAGLPHLMARGFGGKAPFTQYGYAFLLFSVPLSILGNILYLIPFIGFIFALAAWIYSIVIQILMTMGVHRISGGKASASVLLTLLIAFVLSCAFFFATVAVVSAIVASATHPQP